LLTLEDIQSDPKTVEGQEKIEMYSDDVKQTDVLLQIFMEKRLEELNHSRRFWPNAVRVFSQYARSLPSCDKRRLEFEKVLEVSSTTLP